jgi:phospholipase D1/2
MSTDPRVWFLTKDEIKAARGGHPRTLADFTAKNKVQALIDGEEALPMIAADIKAAANGGFIHLGAWKLDHTINLDPRAGTIDTVLNLWRNAVSRQIKCRMLLWRNDSSFHNFQSYFALHPLGVNVVLDARFKFLGSHHQKFMVVQLPTETVAYCGGIDLATDRWDTRKHDNDPHRQPESYAAWHDVHVRIRGDAVKDFEQNFRDRWNAPESPSDLPIPTPQGIIPPMSPPEAIPAQAIQVAKTPGTHFVQVTRTFGCSGNHYSSFAPKGETTCLKAYLKAISQAQKYVYIEDQYLVSKELAQAIAQVLPRLKKVVMVVPQVADTPPIAAFNWHQNQFIEILKAVDPTKVHVYHLVQPSTKKTIYVHSKVMIVDDVFVNVGSQNVNVRSMTHDSEIGVSVVDAQVSNGTCKFAVDFRRNLWAEHLNLAVTDPLLNNPIQAVQEWERQASLSTSRVQRHTVPMPQTEFRPLWNNTHDPDGRC